jgi:hypothetical protein
MITELLRLQKIYIHVDINCTNILPNLFPQFIGKDKALLVTGHGGP